MQKKIIALAVAGLVSGAAFAQTNVTVYGIADVAWQYSSKSYTDGVKSKSAIDDGGQDASRLGFKGTEDLGDGLSAFFQLEQRFNLDTTGVSGRNSNLGLTSKSWGTIKAGSFGSVHDDYNGYSEAGGMGWGNGAIAMLATGDARNAIEYISPNMSGLEFKLGLSTNYGDGNGDEVTEFDDSNDNNRAYFVSAAYANGPVKAALTYDRSKFASPAVGTNSASEWLLGGSYNFGMLTLAGSYQQASNANYIRDLDVDLWQVGVIVPVGAAGNVHVAYGEAEYDFDGESKSKSYTLAYTHALSKRTTAYVGYNRTDNDEGLALGPIASGVAYNATTDVVTGTGEESDIVAVGIRHTF